MIAKRNRKDATVSMLARYFTSLEKHGLGKLPVFCVNYPAGSEYPVQTGAIREAPEQESQDLPRRITIQ